MANGKSKGSEFERVISKKLSLWWTQNERDDCFWRTQNSGGRFTVRKRKGEDTYNQSGDICSTHPISKSFSDNVYIECKSYKNVGIWSLFLGKGQLLEWWKKAYENAQKEEKKTFLIVKENNRPILLFTDCCLRLEICTFYISKCDVNVYSFDSFIDSCSPNEFRDNYIFKNFD